VLNATINLKVDNTMSMFDNNKGVENMSANQDYFETRVDMSAEPISVDEFLADEQTRESSTNRRDFLKFLGFSVVCSYSCRM